MSSENPSIFEVRSVPSNSRKYFNAVFPPDLIPSGTGTSSSSTTTNTEEDKTVVNFPPFHKQWPTPIYLQEQDTNRTVSDDESDHEDDQPQPFKRKRHFKKKAEPKWILSDKRNRNKLIGTASNMENTRFYVMIPPNESNAFFRIAPLENWVTFQHPPKHKPLASRFARELQGKSAHAIHKFLHRKQEVDGEEVVEEEENNNAPPHHGKFQDELEMSDDDRDTKANAKKRRNHNLLDDEDDYPSSGEEARDVMAIDRTSKNRGEGNEDADYEQEFQDDEDDAAAIDEALLQVTNEDDMNKGAEELLASQDQSSSSSSEDEEDGDEDDEDAVARAINAGAAVPMETDVTPTLTKIIREPQAGGASESTTPSTSGKAKASTPLDRLREVIISTLRSNGGTMVGKNLLKEVRGKGVLKKIGMSKEEATEKAAVLIKEIADIATDEISNLRMVTLKQKYA